MTIFDSDLNPPEIVGILFSLRSSSRSDRIIGLLTRGCNVVEKSASANSYSYICLTNLYAFSYSELLYALIFVAYCKARPYTQLEFGRRPRDGAGVERLSQAK